MPSLSIVLNFAGCTTIAVNVVIALQAVSTAALAQDSLRAADAQVESAAIASSQINAPRPAVRELVTQRDRIWIEARKRAADENLDEAIPLFHQALEFQRTHLGADKPSTCMLLHEIAACEERLSNYAQALITWRESETLSAKLWGAKHWRTLDTGVERQWCETASRLAAADQRRLAEATKLARQSGKFFSAKKYADAREVATSAAAIYAELLGPGDGAASYAWHQIGVANMALGEHVAARPMLEKCVAARERLYGVSNPRTLVSLRELGVVYIQLREPGLALPILEKVLKGRRIVDGPKHAKTIRALRELADFYCDQKQYKLAESRLAELLKLQRELHGKAHDDIVDTLQRLKEIAAKTNHLAQETEYIRLAYETLRELHGQDHHATGLALLNLGTLECKANAYDSAEVHLKQAAESLARSKGETHADTVIAIHIRAANLGYKGDYAQSERSYRHLLDVTLKTFGEKSPHTARVLNELGGLYLKWGDLEKAETHSRRALECYRQSPNATPQDIAFSMIDLSSVVMRLDRVAEAETLAKDAVKLAQQQPKPDITLIAAASLALQIIKERRGNEPKSEEAVQAIQATLPEETEGQRVIKALFFEKQAQLALDKFENDKALAYANQAMEVYNQPPLHPSWAQVLTIAGAANYGLGRADEAKRLFDRTLQIAQHQLDRTAAAQSERQQLIFAAKLRQVLEFYLSLPDEVVSAEEAYKHLLLWKGAIQARQARTRRSLNQNSTALAARLQDINAQLTSLSLRVPGATEREQWLKDLNLRKAQKDDLEAELAYASAPSEKDAFAEVSPAIVSAALPDKAALVDVFEFIHYQFQNVEGISKPKLERRYVAFISRADRGVARVDLGPADPMNATIEKWRSTCLFEAKAVRQETAVRLRELLWKPLEPHLQGCSTIVFSPDAELSRLPLGALPGNKPGSYLIEDVAIGIVPVPRMLPQMLSDNHQNEKSGTAASLLVVGDIDYDASPGESTATTIDQITRESREGGEIFGFEPLASAPAEMQAIRATFQQRCPQGKLLVLERAAATESAFRHAAPHHAWLLLATHGFFAPPGMTAALAGSDDGERRALNIGKDHSGVLSGMALAGANSPSAANCDDGILTAYEVASMDLRQTDMAVLSGCQTGLGQLASGEGALGLQRAFQVAGARTTVASLWNVPDSKTSRLMQRFYGNLWDKKLSKLEALREAQLWIMRPGGKATAPEDETNSPSDRHAPYYWAAFVLSGDWR